jgi:hypothetical protein
MSHVRFAILAAMLALTSCAFPVESETAAPVVDAADVDAYERDVHPLLEASCATLDCHGADRRPLRLYAETGRRARADRLPLLVTRDELEANVRALRTLDLGEPDAESAMLLLKPLARSAGGVDHVGGDLWPSREAPGYVCLRAFLLRESDTPAARAACAAAYEEVRLPERP